MESAGTALPENRRDSIQPTDLSNLNVLRHILTITENEFSVDLEYQPTMDLAYHAFLKYYPEVWRNYVKRSQS